MPSDQPGIVGSGTDDPAEMPKFNLRLNPGRDDAALNPECPVCQQPIKELRGQAERRFVCGCPDLRTFKIGQVDKE